MSENNFINDREQYIWLDGEFLLWDDAKIHVLTHALHYSGAVFEGEKAYNGKVFKLEEHTERLIKSAHDLNMKINYSAAQVNQITYELLAKNQLKNAYIRPLIWRGDAALGLCAASNEASLLILAKESLHPMEKGVSLCFSKWRKAGPDVMPVQCKSSAHYEMARVAQESAKSQGFDDAIILDFEGFIAESTTSNIFFFSKKHNKLYTPIADRFLNGITRQAVIEMMNKIGVQTEEIRIKPQDISQYDACFLTGTAAEIKGVGSITMDNRTKSQIKCNKAQEAEAYNNRRATSNDDTVKNGNWYHMINFKEDDFIDKIQNEYAKLVGKNI